MLDIKQVRKDPQSVAEALKKKRFNFALDEFVRLDSQRKEADIRSQNLLAERKKASKQIGALIAQGKSVDDAKAEVNETLDRLSAELDAAVEDAKTVQQALDELLMGTPNLRHISSSAPSRSQDTARRVTRARMSTRIRTFHRDKLVFSCCSGGSGRVGMRGLR